MTWNEYQEKLKREKAAAAFGWLKIESPLGTHWRHKSGLEIKSENPPLWQPSKRDGQESDPQQGRLL